MPRHPFNQRLLAENLVRVRRADDRERYAASQRQARIDPNPHQIDAVIFALRRLREGGCILADEVGLGKTIEAGLVIAQSRAEGHHRILLIVPKSLIGQWQHELLNLFSISASESRENFAPPGVYLVGREFAGSERGSESIAAAPPFDLVVIDEAHEIFAGIHKRYGRDGIHDETSEEAQMAHRVRGFLRGTPVLLLTATPMQNSLVELWGLVQYVEQTGTLLGDLSTFRRIFCDGDDRVLVPGQEHELRTRLATVLKRTLRRQAQEFLDRPFTQRRCRLYDYTMSAAERSLYDDITEYLMQPTLYAFAGRQRRLLLILFHRRMGSSVAALTSSLENVVARLKGIKSGARPQKPADDEADDLEEEERAVAADQEPASPFDPETLASELALVESFVARARALPDDAKARSFVEAVRVVLDLGRQGATSGKAVVFTESITTQEYLRRLLLKIGLADEEITLFRGNNDHPRAHAAHERWLQEEGRRFDGGARPSHEVAVRLALVHEFRTRSKILVCTEAGAKGLNLQFCETVINYDLPWNPQRIEQRIGRCHRYSQARDVTVVNFIGRDNAAQQLTFEILSQKLDLFGRVLDASDTVLHEPRTDAPELLTSALSVEFEKDFRSILTQARSIDEMTRELAALRDKVAERREAYEREYARTSQIIESQFDEQVRKVFRNLRDSLPQALAELDRDVATLVESHLTTLGLPFTRTDSDGEIRFELDEAATLPAECGDARLFATGDARRHGAAESLDLSHPLVQASIASARQWSGGSIVLHLAPTSSAALASLSDQAGCLRVVRVQYDGFEPVQQIVAAAVMDGTPIEPQLAQQLLQLTATDDDIAVAPADTRWLDDAAEEALFVDQRDAEVGEQAHFEMATSRLERYVEDKLLVATSQQAVVEEQLRAARTRRDQIVGATAREKVESEIARLEKAAEECGQRIVTLESREDEDYRTWRDKYHERRYQPPTVTTLFQVQVRVSPANPA